MSEHWVKEKLASAIKQNDFVLYEPEGIFLFARRYGNKLLPGTRHKQLCVGPGPQSDDAFPAAKCRKASPADLIARGEVLFLSETALLVLRPHGRSRPFSLLWEHQYCLELEIEEKPYYFWVREATHSDRVAATLAQYFMGDVVPEPPEGFDLPKFENGRDTENSPQTATAA